MCWGGIERERGERERGERENEKRNEKEIKISKTQTASLFLLFWRKETRIFSFYNGSFH